MRVGELGEILKGKGISKAEVKQSGLPCIRYGELYTTYNYYFEKTTSFIDKQSARNSQEIKKGEPFETTDLLKNVFGHHPN